MAGVTPEQRGITPAALRDRLLDGREREHVPRAQVLVDWMLQEHLAELRNGQLIATDRGVEVGAGIDQLG